MTENYRGRNIEDLVEEKDFEITRGAEKIYHNEKYYLFVEDGTVKDQVKK